MSRPLRTIARPAVLAALALGALPAAATRRNDRAAARSNYAVRPACARRAPATRAAWRCSSCRDEPRSAPPHAPDRDGRAVLRAHGPRVPSPTTGELGLRPQDLHCAYSLPDDARRRTDDRARRRLQRPDRRSRPENLRRRIRPARAAPTAERLLHTGRHRASGGAAAVPENRQRTRRSLESASEARTRRSRRSRAAGASRSRSTSSPPTRPARTARSCSSRPNTQELTDLDRRASAARRRSGATEISNSWGAPEEALLDDRSDAAPLRRPGHGHHRLGR